MRSASHPLALRINSPLTAPQYDAQHTMGSGKGFLEDDTPNFEGSFYSKTKIQTERVRVP